MEDAAHGVDKRTKSLSTKFGIAFMLTIISLYEIKYENRNNWLKVMI